MSSNMEVAQKFFAACESGQGWQGCSAYCSATATFGSQVEALAEIQTLQAYTDWMQGLLGILPDGSYELKGMAEDEGTQTVIAYGVFSGTHTGEGGPVPPTGQSTRSDYVYSMEFSSGKITHMVKIWNAGWALKELGWA